MDIVKDEIIRTKFHSGFDRGGKVVKEITTHATGGGGTLGYVQGGGRAELYVKGVALFHYLINTAGVVTEIIDPDKWAYHSSSGNHDAETIGIEIEKPSSTNSGKPNVQQMKSYIELIEYLRGRFPTIISIATHDYNRAFFSQLPPKPCPGDFDWSPVMEKFPDLTFKGV